MEECNGAKCIEDRASEGGLKFVSNNCSSTDTMCEVQLSIRGGCEVPWTISDVKLKFTGYDKVIYQRSDKSSSIGVVRIVFRLALCSLSSCLFFIS